MTVSPRLARLLNDPRLAVARVAEGGVLFATGLPVQFTFIRNTEKSPQMGSRFGQDIEPSGRYLQHDTARAPELARGWERGVVRFHAPLVLWFSPDGEHRYGPSDWKHRLAEIARKKRTRLSRFLRSLGVDGIVTVVHVRGDVSTSEIVDLTGIR